MNYKQKMIKEFEKHISNELAKVVEIENQDEKLYKMDTLYKMHKVFTHYEELEPMFEQFFMEKARKDRFKRGDRER